MAFLIMLAPPRISNVALSVPTMRISQCTTRASRAVHICLSAMQSSSPASRKSQTTYHPARRHSRSLHWLFRSNIPRRRNVSFSPDIRKRNFFGLGEIMQVLVNPKETVRSLTESKRLLEEARREITEHRERSQLRTKHTFSRLPGFFPRNEEIRAIENALDREPSFTILFGSPSVGKTAMLREVLSRDKYHVLHVDLRIAGFADLPSLYTSLSQQMEQYFEDISKTMDGYQEFEREAWGFKHDRLNVERRISDPSLGMNNVKTSDVARLMELFQSSLLKYWGFKPLEDGEDNDSERSRRRDSDESSDKTRVEPGSNSSSPKRRWGFRALKKPSGRNCAQPACRTRSNDSDREKTTQPKKIPVLFFDEAHKLPTLIQSTETMKTLLDSMLVLTKQDRLCHVIHATSDPFYQTWLRQINVIQHCKVLTIGDCTKAETRAFFHDRILAQVPEGLRAGLDFESLYEAFGGRLAHWQDYIADYVSAHGNFDVKRSPHFLQAHALLNLHIIHSSQAASSVNADAEVHEEHSLSTDAIHPALGPAGLKVYSPTQQSRGRDSGAIEDRAIVMVAGYYNSEFSAMQLLKVMSRLSQADVTYLPYFLLCREIGVRAVDGMVKGRVLDLRWTETVSKEGSWESRNRGRGSQSIVTRSRPLVNSMGAEHPDVAILPDGQMQPIYEEEEADDQEEIVVGPKLVPVTPIMRYAMREVVQEYEDEQSVSEYASLSDVDEY